MHKYKVIIILLIPVLLLAACGSDDNKDGTNSSNNALNAPLPTSSAITEVVMVNTSFQPQQVEIAVGTTVTWTNQDSVTHTVTAGPRSNPSGLFDSGEIASGGTFSFTFTQPGTYEYHCTPHPGMDGTIIVSAPEG